MLFSICIPVYNTSKYLREAVESVLEQNEKDYEIVLVDDGSTDESRSICDKYAADYPNIRVIHKANEGLMMTRRRGFQEAKGDYFVCLDSDDYLCDNHALEKIRRMIDKDCCDLVLYNYIAGKEDPKNDQMITLFDHPDGFIFDESNKRELYDKILVGRDMNAIWIKAVSRKIVDIDVDYSVWKSEICRGEDRFQMYPVITNARRIGYIKDRLVHYRWTSGSISNNPKLKFYNAFRCIYRREDEYIKRWNIDDKTIKQSRLKRIPQILGILTNGYYASKKTGKLDEWKSFIEMVSRDEFFKDLFPVAYRKDIFVYYRYLGKLIMNNNTFMLTSTLDMYEWYSANIKHKK